MAKRALGTKLYSGDETSGTQIGGLTSIGGIELTADTMDETTLDSDGGYREFQGGFKDGGEVSLEGYFDPGKYTGQKEMYDRFEAGDASPFVIKFPGTMGKWSFNGVVTGYGTNESLEDLISFSVTIKVSGKPTLTTGSGA